MRGIRRISSGLNVDNATKRHVLHLAILSELAERGWEDAEVEHAGSLYRLRAEIQPDDFRALRIERKDPQGWAKLYSTEGSVSTTRATEGELQGILHRLWDEPLTNRGLRLQMPDAGSRAQLERGILLHIARDVWDAIWRSDGECDAIELALPWPEREFPARLAQVVVGSPSIIHLSVNVAGSLVAKTGAAPGRMSDWAVAERLPIDLLRSIFLRLNNPTL